jgi:uncharacterized FlaG/YvyC family protein
MRQFTYPGLTTAGILLIILGTTQAAQTTASQPQQQVSQSQQAASNDVQSRSDEKCQDLGRCMKQIEAQVRTIEKEIEARLPELERARRWR